MSPCDLYSYVYFMNIFLMRYYLVLYDGNKYTSSKAKMNENAPDDIELEYLFLPAQLEHLIIYTSTLLELLTKYKDEDALALIALTSYRAELKFAEIRRWCMRDYSLDNV